jgi:hypothetical protein
MSLRRWSGGFVSTFLYHPSLLFFSPSPHPLSLTTLSLQGTDKTHARQKITRRPQHHRRKQQHYPQRMPKPCTHLRPRTTCPSSSFSSSTRPVALPRATDVARRRADRAREKVVRVQVRADAGRGAGARTRGRRGLDEFFAPRDHGRGGGGRRGLPSGVVVVWPSRVGVSRVESGRVVQTRERGRRKSRAGQNRTEENKKNRSKRFGTCGFAVAVKGTVACLGLGVRGSGNEHAAAHAKARTEKELLGDGESQTESTYVAEQTRPWTWTWGITINQSIVISERTARTEPLALPRRRRRRRLRLVAQAPLRRFVTRPRLQGVATVACQQRCPRESVHITFLYLLWYNSSRGCAATYVNIPPVDQTNRRAASRK